MRHSADAISDQSSKLHDLAEAPATDGLNLQSTDQLVIAAQAGSAGAFAELFQRFRPRLQRFLEKRLAGCAVDADDVTQEAFARAWQHLTSYDRRYQFTTWLYTIALRIAHDHLRRRQLRSTRESQLEAAEVVCSSASPVAEVERTEQKANIWDMAKHVLSTDQFSATWLRYGEELSVTEVARVLRKTSVGIRVLLHRSRTILKKHLADYAPLATSPQRKLNALDSESQEESQ
jgi:RNA polymerase sigma-70 factor, ECF subfamily